MSAPYVGPASPWVWLAGLLEMQGTLGPGLRLSLVLENDNAVLTEDICRVLCAGRREMHLAGGVRLIWEGETARHAFEQVLPYLRHPARRLEMKLALAESAQQVLA